ncbi:DNA glycosylase [Phellopilus nigrolimitatus]|nr:DNA glycosylase [Phellopilus nigrolimitatus]
MPVTRSATCVTRQSSNDANARPLTKNTKSSSKTPAKGTKKATSTKSRSTIKTTPAKEKEAELKQVDKVSSASIDDPKTSHLLVPPVDGTLSVPALLPAVLSFSFDDARKHLIDADPRFDDLFSKMKCRPFEHLERVDPFRTLTTSILGQQISWLAARSITHKFIRLFDPSMPEKPAPSGSTSNPDTFFPAAQQVSSLDIPTLRTAGLSGRKAEYVQDLAARFADGRLSNNKILQANDEALYEMLVAVRGIGKWTVDMFAIFSLRRPDILPVGDLGVQRGIVRWFLSLHSPKHTYSIAPNKLPKGPADTEENKGAADALPAQSTSSVDARMDVDNGLEVALPARALTPDASTFPPAPVTPVRKNGTRGSGTDADDVDIPAPPPAFTPSINRTLNKVLPTKYHPPPLPEGMTISDLQSRLEGKKKVKGVLLTPKEMEDLTESWKPYRSLAVFYMWALAEGDKGS